MSVRILHGNCLDILPTLPEASVDSVVTDPPYHLTGNVARFKRGNQADMENNFVARKTDGQGGSPFAYAARGFMGKQWDGGDVAFRPETWRLVFDALKPGAHLVAFGGTRTWHRLAVAIEDAGFEIRDSVLWLYGQGFPKSHAVPHVSLIATRQEFDGWGTALKPAHEPIVLARKPLIGTVAANVLKHGTGGINVDACRIETDDGQDRARPQRTPNEILGDGKGTNPTASPHNNAGRWPANVVHDGSDEVLEAFAAYGDRPGQSGRVTGREPSSKTDNVYGQFNGRTPSEPRTDTGTAARFFYSAKATADDRMGSKHPTIKPLALMDWLVKLITPPGGTVLDPFAGSGTTLLAADRLQMNAIGIDMEASHVEDIRRRFTLDAPLFAEVNV